MATASATAATLAASTLRYISFEHDGSAEHEVAAVPEVTGLDVFGRRGRSGFSTNAASFKTSLPGAICCAWAQIAVAGRRLVRLDAERHNVTLPRRIGRPLAQRHKAGWIARHMVGRQHDDNRVGATPRR